MWMESINNPQIITDSTGLHCNNQYLIQQAIGGSGTGIDLGITTHESEEGYRYGISMINIISTIKNQKNKIILIINVNKD